MPTQTTTKKKVKARKAPRPKQKVDPELATSFLAEVHDINIKLQRAEKRRDEAKRVLQQASADVRALDAELREFIEADTAPLFK